MRFGIIGCGSIAASSFAPSLLNSDRVDLVAVCRRDLDQARAFAQRFGQCAAYDSAAALLDDPQVEAVVVATPTDTHALYTEMAAARGKHVLCEKPMARDAAESRRMIEACQQAGVTLGVAYRRRLFPQVVRAAQLIDQGRIGRIVCVRTHYSGLSDIPLTSWQTQPVIGGALMEMAVHRLDVLLHFSGPPRRVAALMETVRHDWPVDDSDAILLHYDDGKIGVHSTILTSPPRRDSAQVDGTEGRIIIDSLEFGSADLRLETPRGIEEITVEPLVAPYFDQPMIEDFAAAAQEGRQPVCHALAGYWTQAVADAARRAAQEGRTVDVEAW